MRHTKVSAIALLAVAAAASARAQGQEDHPRLYITSAPCAGSPNSPACQSVGTICVTQGQGRITGVVERLSAAQREHKVPPGLRFELSASDLKGRFMVGYPTGDRCKNNLHEFPAQATFGGEGAGKYLEFSYPYRSLDLKTCALSGAPSEQTTRLYEVTDGSACGGPRSTTPTDIACESGTRRFVIQLAGAEAGKFQGISITNEQDKSRTVLSPATLEKAAKAGGTPIFTWRNGAGETRTAHLETVIEAACGGKADEGAGAAVMKMLLRKDVEKWLREYGEGRCKGDKACLRSLDVSSAGPGVRG
jgi:hypothetical protein